MPDTAVPADLSRLQSQAQQEASQGKTAEAILDYQQALAIQPGWIEGWWNLGMLQYNANAFRDAQTSFGRVTVLAPDFGNGWALFGLSEYETEDYDEALLHLERAQTLGIRDDDEITRVSAYHLALLQIRASQFDGASDLLKATFGTGVVPQQARIALGLATLRVPLLPQQVDPSQEALLEETGDAAISGDAAQLSRILHDHPDVPYLHLALCRVLSSAGKNREALEQCRVETRISPESPLAWSAASRVQLQMGEKSAALRSAEAAIHADPASVEARRNLTEVEQAAGIRAQAVDEEPPAEMPVPSEPRREQRIVKLYGGPAVQDMEPGESNAAAWKQALQAYVAGDYAVARTDLEKWLATEPANGTGWALLGLCEFAQGDYDSALIHLDRGARLGLSASSESIDQARYTYGILLVHAGRFEEAETVLARVSDQVSPLRPKVQFALGLALLRRAQLPGEANPAESDLIESAGQIALLLQQSRYDEAFPRFRTLLDRYPNAPFLHYAYGTALIALSEFDQAAAQMEAERKISPRSELPCLRLASIALREDNPTPAVQTAQCALALAPDSVDAHYLLGRAALETNDLPTAIRQLEIARTQSPESPEIRFNLARAYARAKLPEKAEEEREAFRRLSEKQKATHASPPNS